MKRLAQSILGSEFALRLAQKLARLWPASAFVRRLCWHAGVGARDKTRIRTAQTAFGFQVSLNLSDYTFRDIFFSGRYEDEVTATIMKFARAGQVWWDIGANIGWYTLLISKLVGDSGKVYAFEPNPATSTFLETGLSLNDSRNVILNKCGLGDTDADLILYLPKEVENLTGGHGRPSLLRHADIGEVETLTVPVARVDDLIKNGMPAPFGIKMDVEGFEAAVLDGGKALFSQSPPAIVVCEANHFPNCLVTPAQLLARFMDLGYRVFHVENLREYDPALPIDGSWSKDFVFLHRSMFETLLPQLNGRASEAYESIPTPLKY